MNRSGGFGNKLIYLAVIVVMLLPLYLLGQPATDTSKNTGGQLTRMRSDLNLAEANLGEIDPASESMKLASLGLRGFAASLLWRKAEEFKRSHEWDRLSATLNQISNLQPHYENVWEHQAHNLSYNVSVEFDDYRQRYAWVKKGMDYLTEGVRRNRTAPRLVWYTGWFYGQKLGMSDEKVQFRELFRADEPFHAELKNEGIDVDSPDARGPDGRPDNWLVGRLWLNRGYELVDGGLPLVGKTAVTFFEVGPKWRIQHAAAIEKEGVLDDRSKGAWERAADDWYGYGVRALPASDGTTVQLAKVSDLFQRRGQLVSQFEAVAGDTLRRLKDERQSSLNPEQIYALGLDPRDRTREEMIAAMEAEQVLNVDFVSAAKAAPDDQQLKAIEIASQIADIDNKISKNNVYRNQMNYDYWALRCEAEQDDLMIEARRLLFDAKKLYQESDLDGEISLYEEAFKKWREIYDKYPGLVLDTTSDDVLDAINRYRVATDQAELPQEFPLRVFYEMHANEEITPNADEYLRLLAQNGESKDATTPRVNIFRPYTGGDQKPDIGGTGLPEIGLETTPLNLIPENDPIEKMEAKPAPDSAEVKEPAANSTESETPADPEKSTEEAKPAEGEKPADQPSADDKPVAEEKPAETPEPPTGDKPAEEPSSEPQPSEPKVDEPKVDEPKVDEPKVDEPKVDEPKVDEPTS